MIDYVKIQLLNIDTKRLLDLFDFETIVSVKTGELSNKIIAHYHFCKIIVYDDGAVYFKGSIHKLWNSLNNIEAPNYNIDKINKGFNGNQFTLENIFEVRNHLENLFDCKSHQMKFQNIEFGVNTTPNFNPKLYIKGLLYHRNILFEYRFKGNFAQVQHQRFIFKIYNKSNQYGMIEYVLRIELKIIKMEELKKIGINTFADINSNTLNKAKQMLLKRFDEIIHYDYTIIKKGLTKVQKQSLKSYSNPHYWINDLRPQHRDRHKKNLNGITQNNSEKLQQQLRQNIIQKCVIINQLSINRKCVINNTSSIGLNITPLNNNLTTKICTQTGLDISMQKDTSIYLSHVGLKYIFQNDRKLFEIIKQQYLPLTWVDANFQTIIKEIAHNIRTRAKDLRKKQKRLYPMYQMQLFNINL